MSSRHDHESQPNLRKVVVGLAVAAAAFSADLAGFQGHLDTARIALFSLACTLAGSVIVLTPQNKKRPVVGLPS
jgi:hypothetical protein